MYKIISRIIIFIVVSLTINNINSSKVSAFTHKKIAPNPFLSRFPYPTRWPFYRIRTPTPTLTLTSTPTLIPTNTPTPTPLIINDSFNGPNLDFNIWEFFSTNGGNYNFDNGSIVVAGGTSMFYIRSKDNPFPTSGTFTVEFGIQYTLVDESGIGVAVGFEQQNGYDPSNVPVAYWQGSNFGLQVVRFGLTEVVIGGNPDHNYHVGKIVYDGEKYLVYLDGVLKYTSPLSAISKSLWFGNPFCCRSNWTGLKLDYIKVMQL